MITEMPTPAEFFGASLGHLNLAWDIAMELFIELKNSRAEEWDTDGEVSDEYWAQSQTSLANAFALVQQAQEFALKGKISEASPFLLITRDPRDWPKRCDKGDVRFSVFRTADAADLIKICDTFTKNRLPQKFATFYDEVRRLRNVIMHHGSKGHRITVRQLFVDIIRTHNYLFAESRWAEARSSYLFTNRIATVYSSDHAGAALLSEFKTVLEILEPQQAKQLLGFDKKVRRYICPYCNDDAYDLYEHVPLAQLRPNLPTSTEIYCFVCDRATKVLRVRCSHSGCKSNVIADEGDRRGHCLVCYQNVA